MRHTCVITATTSVLALVVVVWVDRRTLASLTGGDLLRLAVLGCTPSIFPRRIQDLTTRAFLTVCRDIKVLVVPPIMAFLRLIHSLSRAAACKAEVWNILETALAVTDFRDIDPLAIAVAAVGLHKDVYNALDGGGDGSSNCSCEGSDES